MNKSVVTLAIYPNKRGFGYACLDWPQKIIDLGIVTVRPLCNKSLFRRFEKFLDFHRPEIIIIRDSENITTAAQRSVNFIRKITDHATAIKVPIHKYSRQQIRDVFEQFEARSKYEIARKLIEWYPELESRTPTLRKPWMDEDYHMPIFDALSLAVAHKYLTE